MYFRFSIE
jgi:hypothetical protein